MNVVHSCRQVSKDHFKCGACTFEGSLSEMVRHVVTNQFVVTR